MQRTNTSCSCVVAGRLANLDHNLHVMLIEAGESNLNDPWVFRPGIYPKNMKLDSKTASFYYSRPSEWLGGRRAIVPCANILGGGSSINFMMYTRASASDYDDFQAKGWTTKELIPLMKKHETYQRACKSSTTARIRIFVLMMSQPTTGISTVSKVPSRFPSVTTRIRSCRISCVPLNLRVSLPPTIFRISSLVMVLSTG